MALYSPHDGNRPLKRVVGVPGDRIEMKDNRLIVNCKTAIYRETSTPDGDSVDPARSFRPRFERFMKALE